MDLAFKVLVLFLLSWTVSGQDWKCQRKTDIIFVLDRSGSIRLDDYNRMKSFLNVVADKMQIGVENDDGEVICQGAIVTFSEDAVVQINLSASRTAGAFADTVNSLPGPVLGGRTKTHLALALADQEVAQRTAGFREDDNDVKRMLVVITDGVQSRRITGYVPVSQAILPFFERDIEVFAFGIGRDDQRFKDDINDMVEVPQNAIFLDSYTDLINQENDFVRRFCPGT